MLSEVSGKKIVYEDISPEQYKANLEAANSPAPLVGFMTGAAATVKAGLLAEVSYTIGDLTGIPAEDGLAWIKREVQKTAKA